MTSAVGKSLSVMPPDPTVTFSIPSVHDDTLLECRVYVPLPSAFPRWNDGQCRVAGGAIVAHPYATFGGCFDDHVVLILVTELLRQHYVVGTFNFRGAGASRGRTSWTSKPEVYDYISFLGFFLHYLNTLRLPYHGEAAPNSPDAPLAPIPTGVELGNPSEEAQSEPTLILSGYSYGSLITTYLPPIDAILKRFAHVKQGTSEAEIRLRASSLASQWNQDAQLHSEFYQDRFLKAPSTHGTSPNSTPLAMGGEESEPGTRRPSQESRRSIDLVRKSLEHSRTHFGRRVSGKATQCLEPPHYLVPITLRVPRICYLLVSPLLPPVSSLATFFSHSHARLIKAPSSPLASGNIDHKLASHPTLAIYGDKDFFVSQHKLRKWADTISNRPSSMFSFHAIADAGHFWQETSSETAIRRFVRKWVEEISTKELKGRSIGGADTYIPSNG